MADLATIEELLAREAIRKTMAKYTVSSAPGKVDFRYAGHEEIRAWQNRWRNREPGHESIHKATFVRHHLATSKIDLTRPDTANVHARTRLCRTECAHQVVSPLVRSQPCHAQIDVAINVKLALIVL